jgi:hypothetical protein
MGTVPPAALYRLQHCTACSTVPPAALYRLQHCTTCRTNYLYCCTVHFEDSLSITHQHKHSVLHTNTNTRYYTPTQTLGITHQHKHSVLHTNTNTQYYTPTQTPGITHQHKQSILHTNKCTNYMWSKIHYTKTLKTLQHVSILISSSDSTYCSWLKLQVKIVNIYIYISDVAAYL